LGAVLVGADPASTLDARGRVVAVVVVELEGELLNACGRKEDGK
jgi:hypothetical protein